MGSRISICPQAAPILLLPPEITAKIFRQCLAPDFICPSPHEAPLLLVQICRQWRQIGLDTPDLWASIAFRGAEGCACCSSGNPRATKSLQLLKIWLSRTRNHPLSLFLQSEDPTKAKKLMKIVKPYSDQWENVFFHLPISAHNHLHMSSFPRLKRLTLGGIGRADASTKPIIILAAPLLSWVSVSWIPHLKLASPANQLTTLDFRPFLDATQAISFLQCCPNLVDLLSTVDVGVENLAPVELPFLRSFAMRNEKMLPYLTAPLLERLEISELDSKDIGAAGAAIAALVSRSSCDLKALSIPVTRTEVAQFQSLLQAANSIEHLELSHYWFCSQIQALRGIDDVLPQLKCLQIGGGPATDGEYRSLLDVLWWRKRHAALELFQLAVDSVFRPSPAVMSEFHELAEAGLQLHITTVEGDRWSGREIVTLLDTRHPE
ncbi:hypothetical protein DFH08DRAFT_1080971 [Mycena albidolilacea]|uniref:F-box domain-containing protein n=1 Tax=Mycena albidolilacea TaxID=1033008 RepID=A0AAD7ESH4_9AGAR|nr:hypothetical protein DFH08DRAFT_1080971 [Mycena albidolilacea]